ncbi:MAG: DNA polymerase III subunit beta [Bacteroidales bacterium]|nr:DNA polymerase III subunit beta [Bacteroidales bacterium]
MKFIVSSSLLLKNLQAISGVLSTSNTLPILDDFLFNLEDENLVVTASDLETTMTVTIATTKAEEHGVVAIPAKILIDTLKTFSDIPITFTIDNETFGIEISAGEGKYKLTGHNSDEFPKVPVQENTTSITFSSIVLAKAITKTVFAAGNDELRPVMSGVFCELSPEEFIFVATDAHKLVKYKRTDTPAESTTSFIIPKKPLNQLKILLSHEDFPVQIDYNDTNAFFSFENVHLACRLIDGKYPNYEAVIPKDNPNILSVDRVQLLNKIRRVSFFANQSTNQIRLKISGKELILSAEDMDYTNEAYERLSCSYEGEDIEIGFNAKFLIEMLNNLSNEQITIELSTPGRAGIIVPVNEDDKNEHIIMLVMPIMLNN